MSLTNPVVSPDGGKLVFDAIPTWRSDSQVRDSSIWLLDLATNRQETLGKGSRASIFWGTP
jgi:Tol biopolymer transport system component